MDSLQIVSIPFDFGQKHSGVRFASEYLKSKGLWEYLSLYCDLHPEIELSFPVKDTFRSHSCIKHVDENSRYNKVISDTVASLDLSNSFLLNIGGDHGMGLGTVHGVLQHHPETVVVWADAHGDINTPEISPSGNFHGMPLAFLLGIAKDERFDWLTNQLVPKNLIFFGPRDLDPGESEIIDRLGIQYFSSVDVNLMGAEVIVDMALHRADPLGKKPIHLSLDVDLFDCQDMKATGTLVKQGPRLEEVFLMGGLLAQTGRLRSMDLVEFNPLIGTQREVEDACTLIHDFFGNVMGQVFAHKRLTKHFRFSEIVR